MENNGMLNMRIPDIDKYKNLKRDLSIIAKADYRSVSRFVIHHIYKIVQKKKAKMIKKGTWPYKEDY